MTLKQRKKGQGGFTLIELVSVVIILGILAAVIVPKYLDMTAAAQNGAYKGALTEGVSRLNLAYSKYILDNNKTPGATATDGLTALSTSDYLNLTSGKVSIGDYQVGYAVGTDANSNDALIVTLYDKTGANALKYSITKTQTTADTVSTAWTWPK